MKNGVYPVGYSVMPIYKESTVSIGGVLEKKRIYSSLYAVKVLCSEY